MAQNSDNILWADSCIADGFHGRIIKDGYSDFSQVHGYDSGDIIVVGTIKDNFLQLQIQRNYAHIMRIKRDGSMIWSRFIGINNSATHVDLRTYASVVTANGDIMVLLAVNAGEQSGNFMIKMNGDGVVLWQKKIPFVNSQGLSPEVFNEITASLDGSFFIAGFKTTTPLYMKMNAAGDIMWRRGIFSGDFKANITAATEGANAYYLSGNGTSLTNNFTGAFVIAVSKTNGDILWVKWISITGSPAPLSGYAEYEFDNMNFKNGVVALTGNTRNEYTGDNRNGQIALYIDEQGNFLSAKRIENMAIETDPANIFHASLFDPFSNTGIQFQNSTAGDYYIFRLGNDNAPIWKWQLPFIDIQNAKDSKVLNDSSFVATGFNRDERNNISASLLKTSITGKPGSCTYLPYDLSVTNLLASLQDIPNINQTIYFNDVSVPSFLDTMTGYGFNWQLECNNISGCRMSKISGNHTVCKGGRNLFFLRKEGVNCTGMIFFSSNSPAIIQTASDTSAYISFLTEGNNTLYATMQTDCGLLKDSISIDVKIFVDNFSLGNDRMICRQNTISLTGGNGFSNYIWQDGSSGNEYSVTSPGIYYATASDVCGNAVTDTINITQAPAIDFFVGEDRVKCNADTLHINAPAVFYNYQWLPDYYISSTNRPTIIVKPLNSIHYTVTAEKYPGCLVFDTILIEVKTSPALHLGKDTFICNNQPLRLNAGQAFDRYLWNDGSTTTYKTITQAGTYWVKGYFNNGCTSSDTITVNNSGCPGDIFIPNAFTPNNSGFNEVFKPVIYQALSKYHLQIFTRWGDKVFETNNINHGWDGKYKGKMMDASVLVYVCTYKITGKSEKIKQGTITLLK